MQLLRVLALACWLVRIVGSAAADCAQLATSYAQKPSDWNGWVSLSPLGTKLWIAANCDQFYEGRYGTHAAAQREVSGSATMQAMSLRSRGDMKGACALLYERHRVKPGSSWGILDPGGVLLWKALDCD